MFIEKLQGIERINSSKDSEDLLRDAKKIIDLLPTGPRNCSDLMECHESKMHVFASHYYPVLITEMILKMNNELSQELSQLLTITDNFEFITETLHILTNGKILDNNSSFMAHIIKDLILNDGSYLIFCFIRLSHANYIHDELKLLKIKEYIQQLVSLPDKIANRLKSNFPEAFKKDIFVGKLTINLLKSFFVMVHINSLESTQVYSFTFIAGLLSKIASNFKSSRALDCALKILSLQAENFFYQESIRDIMGRLQPSAIEIVATKIFENQVEKSQIAGMIGSVWKASIEWKFVLTKKIPLLSYSKNDSMIENLVYFLVNDDSELVEELLMEMLTIWSSKSHVLETPFEQHVFVTKFIVLMITYLLDIKGKAEIIRQKLFSGVQMHLGSSNSSLRALGMITAETIIQIIDNDCVNEEEKLKFDYDSFDEKIIKEVVTVIAEFPNRKIIKSCRENKQMECEIEDLMTELIMLSENETYQVKSIESPQECMKIQILETSNERPKIEQELDSDDDDLQPYCNDKLINHKSPKFLTDILRALSVKEEFEDIERFEATVMGAKEIVEQQLAYNHPDIAIDLLKTLIELPMYCFVENFDEIKLNTIIEVCSVYPKECAQYISNEFNTEITKYSLKTRIHMLDILSETAKRLSKLEITNDERIEAASEKLAINKLAIKLQQELTHRSRRDAQKIVRERLKAKTKNKATRIETINETSGINKFTPAAGWFFFPLIKGFGQQQMVFTRGTELKYDSDNILLLKFLNTISVIMLCSKNAPVSSKMAKEIIALSLYLRYHDESQIRLAVLHMFATIILALPQDILITEFAPELNEFMNHLNLTSTSAVINNEPDRQCREFAVQLASMCFNTLHHTEF